MLIDVKSELRTQGYSVARGDQLLVDSVAREAERALASEWNNLGLDNYLKNGARFRERRYGRFYYLPMDNIIRLLTHKPYFQSHAANVYAGGIRRIVEPLTETSVKNPLLKALIEFDFAQFPVSEDLLGYPWEVTCHQFRIVATVNEVGEPTPEGIHRDEVDFGVIHLMSRSNVEGGYSRIYDNSKKLKVELLLESPMDTLFWVDHDVLHSVTPITCKNADRPAIRDVLGITYKFDPGLCEVD